jgi:peptide-methionine (S)-S-oxide reductase
MNCVNSLYVNSINSIRMTDNKSNLETATLGNGCFWCTEAVFQQLKGVVSVTSGYSGGEIENPTYKQVCAGTTGHAECLNIEYDPSIISFEDLLEVFWKTHDPTTLNRQGNDVGTQYRSVVFYHTEEQKAIAAKYKEQLNKSGSFPNPIVTTLEPFVKFYKAEDYHQNYFNENGDAPYCKFVVRPKVEKFEKLFKDKIKSN